MVAVETIQQFALLNQITLSSDAEGGTHTPARTTPSMHPMRQGPCPAELFHSRNSAPLARARFNDQEGTTKTVVRISSRPNVAGFYVFSAPWETTTACWPASTGSKVQPGLPASYAGPNYIYAIAIAPSARPRGHLQQQSESASSYLCCPRRNWSAPHARPRSLLASL